MYLYLVFMVLLGACSKPNTAHTFVLKKAQHIYVHPNADDLVKWAATELATDLNKILGGGIAVVETESFKHDGGIYISDNTNSYFDADSALINRWEYFSIKQYGSSLHICGSDIRGTVYGVFDAAERLGISPWQWWADVKPIKADQLRLQIGAEGIIDAPAVKYRGVFLNDEDWGLQPWAAKTFEPEVGDIGPKTYEKIFQLLLRLKANCIWPAMHPSTQAFYTVQGNQRMAEKYHIVVGTSHAEPMLRNNVGEWNKDSLGGYNYFKNAETVKTYWRSRIAETKNSETLISIGMRGIHDSGMEGDATQEERIDLLKTIIADQRAILEKERGLPADKVPQVLVPYKEVLNLYNAGLQVPDDVTLMWTDDNYGYIRRLSNAEEQVRSGGSGVYYHLSYWGRPHDYLWLSTTSPGLIWYEMTCAYQNGAKNIWIANVGDIKPAEYNTEFFLDLAWEGARFSSDKITEHLQNWCTREFGPTQAMAIADIMQAYYQLAFLRKPEYMGWSQTEPTTATKQSGFFQNHEELDHRMEAYKSLVEKVNQLEPSIVDERKAAFFQLITYPVKGAAFMNLKFLNYHKFLAEKDSSFLYQAEAAFDSITYLTKAYTGLEKGKWAFMMDAAPRRLPVFDFPDYKMEPQAEEGFNNEAIFINAKEYKKAVSDSNFNWIVVEGLGYSQSAVTLMPAKQHYFSDKEKPYLTYEFEVNDTGKFNIELRFLPTHSNRFDAEVCAALDQNDLGCDLINTRGRSAQWKKHVLQNFVAVKKSVLLKEKGRHTLKISVNQTGVVLDQLAITSHNYGPFYEIPTH